MPLPGGPRLEDRALDRAVLSAVSKVCLKNNAGIKAIALLRVYSSRAAYTSVLFCPFHSLANRGSVGQLNPVWAGAGHGPDRRAQ